MIGQAVICNIVQQFTIEVILCIVQMPPELASLCIRKHMHYLVKSNAII